MLYTIGYEGVDVQRFVDALKERNIHTLIDVREMPLSRKKGFSKNGLSSFVQAHSIEYRHMRELGAPRDVRYRLKAGGEWSEYCSGYLTHLAACQDALDELVALASVQDICLMCFEADYRECHRSLISNHLHATGQVAEVVHITPQKGSALPASAVA